MQRFRKLQSSSYADSMRLRMRQFYLPNSRGRNSTSESCRSEPAIYYPASMWLLRFLLLVILFSAASAAQVAPQASEQLGGRPGKFVDVTSAVGVNFQYLPS